MSNGKLNEDRNLVWTERGAFRLMLVFSTKTNCENMAYRCLRSEQCSFRGVRQVTKGILGLWQFAFSVRIQIVWDIAVAEFDLVVIPCHGSVDWD